MIKQTQRSLIFPLIMLVLMACSGSSQAPTSTPSLQASAEPTVLATLPARATATPLPTVTPLPDPTATVPPLPSPTPAAGYYRHPELGFWFNYPASWFAENTGTNMPAVIVSDDDDPLQLWAGAQLLPEGTELTEFTKTLKDDIGLGATVTLTSENPIALADGTPAQELVLQWENEAGDPQMAHGYAVVASTNGYVILLVGRPEVVEARPQTVRAIAGGLHVEQPELYGVSNENALFQLVPEPETLDPALTTAGPDGIVGHIFSGLTRLDQNMQVVGDLAERWEVSADGIVYTFHLQPEAKFHDGRSVTAQDFVTAWNRATDPALDSATAQLYLSDIVGATERLNGQADSISGLTAADEQTLVVTLNAAKPYFLAKLTQPVTFVTQPDNVDLGDSWWQAPLGTGPFSLNRWQPGQVIVLDANKDFYREPPQIETAVFINGNSSFAAYETGLIDFAQVHPHNLARAQDPGEPLAADLVSGSRLCTQRIVFDTTRPPFNDVLVRQAFSLAVDRQQLATVVLQDAALPATGILPPGMPGYIERPFAPTFDLEAAQALLSESSSGSVAALPDLIFAAPGGGSPDAVTTALADMWANHLGVNIETRLIPNADYADALSEPPGHLFLVEWCAAYPDPENMLDLLYHSDSIANYGRYTNPELDTLLEMARIEQEPTKRVQLYQQAEEFILSEAATIQTIHPLSHVLVRPDIQGYQHTLIPLNWAATITLAREK